MKTHTSSLLQILTLIAALAIGLGSLAANAKADEKSGHTHKSAPKGGRLLEKTSPAAEVVIEKDRSVTIHFYNAEMKPIAPTTQSVTAIAEPKSGRSRIEFERKSDTLVSKSKLPAGENYNIVVQFKQTAEAKPQNTRFKLDLSICGECKRSEYACACGH